MNNLTPLKHTPRTSPPSPCLSIPSFRYSRPHRDASPFMASPATYSRDATADGDSLAFNDLVATPMTYPHRRFPYTPALGQFDYENLFGHSSAAGGGVSFGSRLVPRFPPLSAL